VQLRRADIRGADPHPLLCSTLSRAAGEGRGEGRNLEKLAGDYIRRWADLLEEAAVNHANAFAAMSGGVR
jgi:hypothetical protein